MIFIIWATTSKDDDEQSSDSYSWKYQSKRYASDFHEFIPFLVIVDDLD